MDEIEQRGPILRLVVGESAISEAAISYEAQQATIYRPLTDEEIERQDEEDVRRALQSRPLTEPQKTLIENGMRTVRRTAQILGHRWSMLLSVEDLVSVGYEALVYITRDYKPSKSAFSTYAPRRVLWAMLSALRKEATYKHYIRPFCEACDVLMGIEDPSNPRKDEDDDIRMNMTSYSDMIVTSCFMASMVDLERGQGEWAIAERQLFQRAITALRALRAKLSEQEELIVKLHYDDEFPLEKMAVELGMSEWKMRQRHAEVMLKLFNGLCALGITHASGDGDDGGKRPASGGVGQRWRWRRRGHGR